jgi:hypothetical protein
MLARTAAAFGVAERTLAIILQVMAMAQRPAP